jgi:two-component system response regulator PilR (NtrC family)
MARILIVDNDLSTLDEISNFCRDRGHQAYPYSSSEAALESLSRLTPQLVMVDVKMEKAGGFDMLRQCTEKLPQTAVVMISTFGSTALAAEAMKLGAYDYITKPFKGDELGHCIQRALEYQALLRESGTLRRGPRDEYKFENLIGASGRMREIYRLIGKVADTDSTILIQGESGTGKELVARALHYNSARQHQPFLAINCSALPESLLESELFGHKKGAFPGAVTDRTGLFEEANNGTVFLDEVNSTSQQLQAKLLQVLHEHRIRRLGDTRLIPINTRLVAASNESLKAKTRNGGFREDLYFRLAVIPIEIPPLRERMEDVPLLVDCFLQKYAAQTGTELKEIDANAMGRLLRYAWPGNVRELENAVERACALSENGLIRAEDLPPHILGEMGTFETSADSEWEVGQQLDRFVRNQEKKYIEMTLKFNQGSREKTASMLGISIATLYRKLDLKHHRT